MPRYGDIDTDALRAAADKLDAERGKMESSIESADSSVRPCRDQVAPRIEDNVQAWDRTKRDLTTALDALQKAAAIIQKTAADVDFEMTKKTGTK